MFGCFDSLIYVVEHLFIYFQHLSVILMTCIVYGLYLELSSKCIESLIFKKWSFHLSGNSEEIYLAGRWWDSELEWGLPSDNWFINGQIISENQSLRPSSNCIETASTNINHQGIEGKLYLVKNIPMHRRNRDIGNGMILLFWIIQIQILLKESFMEIDKTDTA